ncbi:hypothetical protein DVH24_026027 [Malus domestica]|uniref:Uncharacterized protein n=1 Tax=Malus domestica TaxID=3750 RepID=A0A498KI97_MALDO|nr:hypothetical protein DVH24_026027 [Malus domestica]
MLISLCVQKMATHGVQLATEEEESYRKRVNNLSQASHVLGMMHQKFNGTQLVGFWASLFGHLDSGDRLAFNGQLVHELSLHKVHNYETLHLWQVKPSLKITKISWANLNILFDPQHPYTRIYPWFLDLDLHFPLSDFLKSILLCYNMAICNLSPATFRFITFFELLNQWYGAYLGIQEFRILHILMMSFDDHYYFSTRPSLV